MRIWEVFATLGVVCCLCVFVMAVPSMAKNKAAPAPVRWEVIVWDPSWLDADNPTHAPSGWEPCGYNNRGRVLLKRRVP